MHLLQLFKITPTQHMYINVSKLCGIFNMCRYTFWRLEIDRIVFLKAANNVIIIWKRHYVEVLKGELNSTRTYMYLLSWRKTNYLCIISILSPKSMSKLINVNCLHFIGCQNYTNVLINRVLYQIQVTALLPFFLSILILQMSKIMLWSTVKLLLAIVMSIIFGPFKPFRGHRKIGTA